jgi:hypothetical protein
MKEASVLFRQVHHEYVNNDRIMTPVMLHLMKQSAFLGSRQAVGFLCYATSTLELKDRLPYMIELRQPSRYFIGRNQLPWAWALIHVTVVECDELYRCTQETKYQFCKLASQLPPLENIMDYRPMTSALKLAYANAVLCGLEYYRMLNAARNATYATLLSLRRILGRDVTLLIARLVWQGRATDYHQQKTMEKYIVKKLKR